MAVLPIRTLPDPVLRQKTKRVSTIDNSVKKLIADMLETLHAEEGRVGLAAPQVGVSLRVTVIGLPDEEDIVLINPVSIFVSSGFIPAVGSSRSMRLGLQINVRPISSRRWSP